MNKPQPEDSASMTVVNRGEALMRFENESMQSVAVQRPRDLEQVKKDALAEVNAFPEMADRYFYSIPHRTKACSHPTTQACPTCEYVEGPSINAALALQRYWGNCASTCRIDHEDEDFIHTVGIFTDYERNTRFEKPYRASKWLTKRDGKRTKLNDQRLTMAVNAAASKAQRNAVLSGIPDPLKIMLWTTAKALTVGDEPDKKLSAAQVQQVGNEFGKWNVDVELLEKKLGKKSKSWTMSDRARLLGLRNALLDGQASEELFGTQVKKTQGKRRIESVVEKVNDEMSGAGVEIVTEPGEPPPGMAHGDPKPGDGHGYEGDGLFCSACGGNESLHVFTREPGSDDDLFAKE